jgi:hypothetical protein
MRAIDIFAIAISAVIALVSLAFEAWSAAWWIALGVAATIALAAAAHMLFNFLHGPLAGEARVSMILIYIGFCLMMVGAAVGFRGAWMVDGIQQKSAQSTEGPLKVQAMAFPYDHVDGVQTAGLVWQTGFSRSEINFHNSSSDPIQDLDVIIRPELPIIKSIATSDFAKCQIGPRFGMPAPIVLGAGEDGNMKVAASDGPTDQNITITDSHRLYCDKVAANTSVHVVLATVVPGTNPVMGEMFEKNRRDPTFIDLLLKYQANGKKYEEPLRLTFQ